MAFKVAALFNRTTYETHDDTHYLRAKINEANDGLVVHLANGGAGGTASDFDDTFPGSGTAAGAEDPDGNMVGLQVDAQGNLLVAGSLEVTPVTSTSISAADQETVDTTAETLLAANPDRKRLILQNAGTTVLKFNYGASDPTQSVYHFALRPGGSANDASSPQWIDDMWKGEVRVISSAAGGLCNNSELE